jgi:hypothetical protein
MVNEIFVSIKYIVIVLDHDYFCCPGCGSGRDYQEIPFDSINSIAVDNIGAVSSISLQ